MYMRMMMPKNLEISGITHPKGKHFLSHSLQPQHVLHAIEALFLFDQPPGGAQRAARKGIAAVGAVDEFDPLAQASENHRMIAGNISGANGKKSDLFFGSLTNNPFTAGNADLVQISFQRLSHDPT